MADSDQINQKKEFQRVGQKQKATRKLGQVQTSDHTIEITKNEIKIGHKNRPNEVNNFELVIWQTGSEDKDVEGGPKFESFGQNMFFEVYDSALDSWGVIVHNSVATIWVHKNVNAAHFEIEVMLGFDHHIQNSHEIALRVTRPDLGIDSEFWVEANGLFDIQRKPIDGKNDMSIYPTTSKASIKDPNSGSILSVWTDRPRGVSAKSNSIFLFLQRAVVSHDSSRPNLKYFENTFTKLIIQNTAVSAHESGDAKIRNLVDIEPVIFYGVTPSSELRFRNALSSPEASLHVLPEYIRLTTQPLASESILLRFQNTLRKEQAHLSLDQFLGFYYPAQKYTVVDFGSAAEQNLGVATELPKGAILGPLEFIVVKVQY